MKLLPSLFLLCPSLRERRVAWGEADKGGPTFPGNSSILNKTIYVKNKKINFFIKKGPKHMYIIINKRINNNKL